MYKSIKFFPYDCTNIWIFFLMYVNWEIYICFLESGTKYDYIYNILFDLEPNVNLCSYKSRIKMSIYSYSVMKNCARNVIIRRNRNPSLFIWICRNASMCYFPNDFFPLFFNVIFLHVFSHKFFVWFFSQLFRMIFFITFTFDFLT